MNKLKGLEKHIKLLVIVDHANNDLDDAYIEVKPRKSRLVLFLSQILHH